MAARMEGIQDRWERITPRERGLVILLGLTMVGLLLTWVGYTIRDGLAGREKRNEAARSALEALAEYRTNAAQVSGTGPTVKIPEEAVELEEYLEKISTDVGIKIPGYSSRPGAAKGKFMEKSTKIEINGLSILELKDLLEKIESESKLVVITELHIKRHFRDHDKLDVDLVVATYYQKPEEGSGGEASAEKNGKEG
jgi:hypothetical protein